MQLINQTPAVAQLLVTEMSGEDCRGGLLVAKATFEFGVARAAPRLVTDDPLPLTMAPTPLDDLGELPADLLPREGNAFEVFLLGACYGPGGKPTARERVSMSVGNVTHELSVTGDRHWLGTGASARISPPAEFTRLPLTYERAFGGSAELSIDPHSLYPVFEPLNQRGRGFNPEDYVAGCAAAFECPPGFPTVAPGPRRLPNLEHPRAPIQAWADHRPPVCWAPIPLDVGFAVRAIDARLARFGSNPTLAQRAQANYFRAHPDWTFEGPPPAGAGVSLTGVHPSGSLGFALPALAVLADYEIGARQGTLELAPQLLVILPDRLRFCLVYRAFFRFDAAPGQSRSFRLRLVDGWKGTS